MKFARRLLPRSLAGRVFALYSIVLLAFVAGALGLFYRYQFLLELDDAQLRAEALVVVVGPTVTDSVVIGDYDTIRRTLEHAVYHSNFASASFIDLRGGVVRAERSEPPEVLPPAWLKDVVAQRLYDTNQPIGAGGRDYGVLRLSFSPDRIAGNLWRLGRFALALSMTALVLGILLIRVTLVRWLGNLGKLDAFEETMRTGIVDPSQVLSDDAPIEFRKTFEVLNRAAASMQAQREQASVTLSAIKDAVFTLDPSGSIILANPAACAMVGVPLEGLLLRPVQGVLPEVFRDASAQMPWRTRRVEVAVADGRRLVLDTTLSSIMGAGGAVGHVLACRDVTERHDLDQRLQEEVQARETALNALRGVLEGLIPQFSFAAPDGRADDIEVISGLISSLVARLRERGEQLSAIFALSPDGFVSFDSRQMVTYVSPAFTRLAGLDESQVLGLYGPEFSAALAARSVHAGAAMAAIAELRRTQRGSESGRRIRIELLQPVRRVLELGLVRGGTETITEVLYLRDVTRETEVDQMKSEFLSTAAHELRTPMASIFGFSELMLHRKLSAERQHDVIETIHRQTALMIDIVNELLDLARIEARRGKDFRLERVELQGLVSRVIADFNPPDRREPPWFESCGLAMQVCIDRNKMSQALGNVLSNAYKFSPQGGPVAVRLVQEAVGDGGTVRVGVSISDRGIGMTPAQAARVSERFYRADSSGSIPGTGLGMSIVKEIIELMGGSLQLTSIDGQGTTVTLWLPAVAFSLAGEAGLMGSG